MRIRLKTKHENEPFGFKGMAFLHEMVSFLGTNIYRSIIPKKYDVPKEEAIDNLEKFLENTNLIFEENDLEKNSHDKLLTLGEFYLKLKEVTEVDEETLFNLAKEYDKKGIIPQTDEKLEEFVYRGNTTLFTHSLVKETKKGIDVEVSKKTGDINLTKKYHVKLLREEDLKEANKRIPYHMDLSWVYGSVKNKSELLIPALGLTFTLPQYNGFSFMQMREKYKSRDKFLEVLAHEMTHVGTVYLDNRRDFLETKAYAVGKGSLMGEYAVATNKTPNIIVKIAQYIIQSYVPFVPDQVFKYFPKVKSAVTIAATTGTFKTVKKRLEKMYGQKGNYILGRLTGDEMEEMRFTNDVQTRIDLKDNLKWRIMKDNFKELN